MRNHTSWANIQLEASFIDRNVATEFRRDLLQEPKVIPATFSDVIRHHCSKHIQIVWLYTKTAEASEAHERDCLMLSGALLINFLKRAWALRAQPCAHDCSETPIIYFRQHFFHYVARASRRRDQQHLWAMKPSSWCLTCRGRHLVSTRKQIVHSAGFEKHTEDTDGQQRSIVVWSLLLYSVYTVLPITWLTNDIIYSISSKKVRL